MFGRVPVPPVSIHHWSDLHRQHVRKSLVISPVRICKKDICGQMYLYTESTHRHRGTCSSWGKKRIFPPSQICCAVPPWVDQLELLINKKYDGCNILWPINKAETTSNKTKHLCLVLCKYLQTHGLLFYWSGSQRKYYEYLKQNSVGKFDISCR